MPSNRRRRTTTRKRNVNSPFSMRLDFNWSISAARSSREVCLSPFRLRSPSHFSVHRYKYNILNSSLHPLVDYDDDGLPPLAAVNCSINSSSASEFLLIYHYYYFCLILNYWSNDHVRVGRLIFLLRMDDVRRRTLIIIAQFKIVKYEQYRRRSEATHATGLKCHFQESKMRSFISKSFRNI